MFAVKLAEKPVIDAGRYFLDDSIYRLRLQIEIQRGAGTIWPSVFTRSCARSSRRIPCYSFSVLQASTASDKTTAPRRLVETEPSVARWRTATSARVHPALRGRTARTTSTNATGTRADTAPARTFTDPTSKSNDIVNRFPWFPALYMSSLNFNPLATVGAYRRLEILRL